MMTQSQSQTQTAEFVNLVNLPEDSAETPKPQRNQFEEAVDRYLECSAAITADTIEEQQRQLKQCAIQSGYL